MIWTTKTGQEIPIQEMTTSHLQNTINFLSRQISKSLETENSGYQFLGMLQGEMAIDSVESQLDSIAEEIAMLNLYRQEMQKELSRRSK